MKKWILLFCSVLIFSGCGDSTAKTVKDRGAGQTIGVKDILEQRLSEQEESREAVEQEEFSSAQTIREEQTAEREETEKEPEVDLTAISGTMVYSEVYNMMTQPELYLGRTIRMGGTFTSFHDIETDQYYFACIIQDATACCSQGLEFVLTPDYAYPEDYPQEGDEIVVEGEFDTYMEGEYQYCTLRNARLL